MIIKYLKSKFSIKTFIVYGVSLGGHVAKALASQVDIVILDRTFSSISLIPRLSLGGFCQRFFDMFIDNYRINCKAVLESESRKIILFDPKNDEIIPYLASLTFGLTVELANIFFNKSNRADLEANLNSNHFLTISKRYHNNKAQSDYFKKQLKVLKFSKFLMNERDIKLLFNSMKRLMKVCLIRLDIERPQISNEPQKAEKLELDFNNLSKDVKEDVLDEDALSALHQFNKMTDKNLEDPNFDYSKLIHTQIEKEACLKSIEKIFNAINFIESGGLQASEIFFFPESQQEPAFQALILGIILWGSNLPISVFLKEEMEPFDPMVPLKLSSVTILDLTIRQSLKDASAH